jgi:flagellar protein FlaI
MNRPKMNLTGLWKKRESEEKSPVSERTSSPGQLLRSFNSRLGDTKTIAQPPLPIRSFSVKPASLKMLDSYPVGLGMAYITEDYHYLASDPILEQDEVRMLTEMGSKLIFLMSSEALMNEDRFDRYLTKAGLSEDRLRYFLKREIFGYGILEPLVEDPLIEDIIATSANSPVLCVHSNYGTMPTNITLEPEEMDRYLERLVHLSGRSVSLFRPIITLKLPNGGRLSASYREEVSPRGSNFTIRKFPEKPWSITLLMQLNTLPPEMAAWLMLLEEYRKAFLVSGSTGTGKTSLINALCALLPERSIIVTIEEASELRLVNPHRISLKAGEPSEEDSKMGAGMAPLMEEALGMNADYVVLEQIRGEEGRIWVQAIMNGCGGMATLNAEEPSIAVQRLLSPPISADAEAIKSLRGIVWMGKFVSQAGGRFSQRRRAVSFLDLGPDLELIPLFEYNADCDSFISKEEMIMESNSAKMIMNEFGISASTLLDRYLQRVDFFRLMKELSKWRAEFREYPVAAKAAWSFQSNPEAFDPELLLSNQSEVAPLNGGIGSETQDLGQKFLTPPTDPRAERRSTVF